MSRNIHIVIPVYNQWGLAHEQLWNLFRKEGENISSILLVDDVSPDDEVAGGIRWWCSQFGEKYPIRSITNEENLGFLLSCNKGLREIEKYANNEDIIILLSTDVKIMGKFLSQIGEIIESNSKSLVGGILYTHDTGWNTFSGKIFPYIEGWLLATTVENWKELGYFDEIYAPNDMEDLDLSATAQKLGYELVPLNNVGLQHLGGRSIGYSPEREAITKINQEKFKKKWVNNE